MWPLSVDKKATSANPWKNEKCFYFSQMYYDGFTEKTDLKKIIILQITFFSPALFAIML